MDQEDGVKPVSKTWIGMLFVAVLMALAILGGSIYLTVTDWPGNDGDWTTAGQRGDFWGGHINAAASGLASVLLIITILLQFRELNLQRQELTKVHEEMRDSRKVYEEQKQQMVEQTAIAQRKADIEEVFQLHRRLSDLPSLYTQGLITNADHQAQMENLKRLLVIALSRASITPAERIMYSYATGVDQELALEQINRFIALTETGTDVIAAYREVFGDDAAEQFVQRHDELRKEIEAGARELGGG